MHASSVLLLYLFDGSSIPEILEEIGQPPRERGTGEQNHYRQIMDQRAVHVMAFFILIYIGFASTLIFWGSGLILRLKGRGYSGRLDRFLHHKCTRGRTVLGLHLFRVLWRSHLGSCRAALGEQTCRRPKRSLPLWHSDYGVRMFRSLAEWWSGFHTV